VDFSGLTAPDAVVLVAALVFALRGAVKGFAWQVVRTLALLGALWGAGLLADDAEEWLARNASFVPEFARPVLAWAAMALLIFAVVAAFARMARGAVRTANLSGPDRLLGFLFGALMGVALAAIGIVVWGGFQEDDESLAKALEGSRSVRAVVQVVDLVPLMPRSTRERWHRVLEEVDR
jgi:uncharacterized membrane protein required for colicin V production